METSDYFTFKKVNFPQLENSIEPGPNVLYINLPEEDINDGTECHVIGWGLTGTRKNQMSQILKELSVRILPDETCRTFFTSLSDTQICAKSSSGFAFKVRRPSTSYIKYI